MREILFRGKRICNDVMMFGSLFCDDGDCYIVADDFHHSHYKVLPETVGQYTGLKDKNGKRIFEGDIIRFEHNGKTYVDVVAFDAPMFSPSNSCRWSMWKDEVIGNIHDNPELLGGTNDAPD